QPGMAHLWATLLAPAVLVALIYLGGAVMPPQVTEWFGQQNWFTKLGIYCAIGIVAWLVASAMVIRVAAPLHFALDPAYETERSQRRRIRQLRTGDRLRVVDRHRAIYGTVSRVDHQKGELFDVIWDDDGHKNTHFYFDIDLFEPVAAGEVEPASR